MGKQIITIQQLRDGFYIYLDESLIAGPFIHKVNATVHIKKKIAAYAQYFAPIKGGKYEVIV